MARYDGAGFQPNQPDPYERWQEGDSPEGRRPRSPRPQATGRGRAYTRPRPKRPDYWPEPWALKRQPTLWVDSAGNALVDGGESGHFERVHIPLGGRRKHPAMADLVLAAQQYRARRIMFCGDVVRNVSEINWLLPPAGVPGHTPGRQWLREQPYSISYVPDPTKIDEVPGGAAWLRDDPKQRAVEFRFVEEWFGTQDLTPAQALEAWNVLSDLVAKAFPAKDGKPMGTLANSPVNTGTNLWALSLPDNVDPKPVRSDIAEELHFTSGLHRIEHLVAGPGACKCSDCLPTIDPEQTPNLDGFAYIDGRFMFAAVTRNLGVGPARKLNRSETFDLLQHPRGPYTPMRVKVRFTVPKEWDHVGVLGVKHENLAHGWHYPNKPGATYETYVGGAEFLTAAQAGWKLEPLESTLFTSGLDELGTGVGVLRTWSDKLVKIREQVLSSRALEPTIKAACGTALRNILLFTIGNFAKRLHSTDVVVNSPLDIPPELQGSAEQKGDVWVYRRPGLPHTQRTLAFYHPELAVQVWSLARNRLLSAPVGGTNPEGGGRPPNGGLLAMDPRTIIGTYGDAIYTTEIPRWSLPTSHGGGDDGKVGRLRLKGYLPGPVPTPLKVEDRNKLRRKAEIAGWQDGVEPA